MAEQNTGSGEAKKDIKNETARIPKRFTVRIEDADSGEVLDTFSTDVAILTGVDKGPDSEKVKTYWVGNGPQLQKLLGFINLQVSGHLMNLEHKKHKAAHAATKN